MFEEEGVGFEIPRTMATSDISLRFVLTKYDHHSYRATSSPAMRRRVKMPELPETEEPPQNTEVAEAPGTERQMSETERSTAAPDDPVMALLGGSVSFVTYNVCWLCYYSCYKQGYCNRVLDIFFPVNNFVDRTRLDSSLPCFILYSIC